MPAFAYRVWQKKKHLNSEMCCCMSGWCLTYMINIAALHMHKTVYTHIWITINNHKMDRLYEWACEEYTRAYSKKGYIGYFYFFITGHIRVYMYVQEFIDAQIYDRFVILLHVVCSLINNWFQFFFHSCIINLCIQIYKVEYVESNRIIQNYASNLIFFMGRRYEQKWMNTDF